MISSHRSSSQAYQLEFNELTPYELTSSNRTSSRAQYMPPDGALVPGATVGLGFRYQGKARRGIDQHQLTTGQKIVPADRQKLKKCRQFSSGARGGGAQNRFGGATHIGILYI